MDLFSDFHFWIEQVKTEMHEFSLNLWFKFDDVIELNYEWHIIITNTHFQVPHLDTI